MKKNSKIITVAFIFFCLGVLLALSFEYGFTIKSKYKDLEDCNNQTKYNSFYCTEYFKTLSFNIENRNKLQEFYKNRKVFK